MYKPHTTCRACGYAAPPAAHIKAAANPERMMSVFNLGLQPLANDFRRGSEERSGFAPLEVLFCPRCTLGQLSVVVNPRVLYANYSYLTSGSDTMLGHFNVLCRDLTQMTHGHRLLEIGSNDGALLAYFKGHGFDVLGVDPAENLCKLARGRGVETLCALWARDAAIDASRQIEPDIVLARHVFCHVDNWRSFIDGLSIVCKRDSVVCIEVPHAQKLLENQEFDTIYHEHLSYLTLRSMETLLRDSPFRLAQVINYPIHGGALLLMLVRCETLRETPDAVKLALEQERAGLDEWREFSNRAEEAKLNLIRFVEQARSEGKTVAGLGASAKSTVWVNACHFQRKDISFIADSTPQKWFTTSPGTDIPVVDEGAILRELPDYTVMFCWNFREEVLERNQLYRQKGGKFIIPIPKLEVI